MLLMLKQIVFATGLSVLAFSATPAAAQDSGKCEAAAGHVKVFDGNNLTPAPRGTAAGDYIGLDDIKGESKSTAATGGVRVAAGDVNGDGATGQHIKKATLYGRKAGDDKRSDGEQAARMKSQNNLKQMGLANTCR
jgi:hypothetical protein